jgi:hypothetical protein
MAPQAEAAVMSFDILTDILNTIGRTYFAFWLRDPTKREHNIPAKFLVALTFLIMSLMALFGRGTNAVASAIYAIFFLTTLCFAAFIVVLRSHKIKPNQVVILVEAYVVMLFLTLLLMFHNVIFPISFFSIDAGVDRGLCAQLRVSYLYSLPAAIYVSFCTYQFTNNRISLAAHRLKNAELRKKLLTRVYWLRIEVIAWAVFHYLVAGALIWFAVFAPEGRLKLIEDAVKKLS